MQTSDTGGVTEKTDALSLGQWRKATDAVSKGKRN